MEKKINALTPQQLKDIVEDFRTKFERGLQEENTEIQCIPTYISPKTTAVDGRAMVLDLGGTNYRAAIVEFVDGNPEIHPQDGWKKKLDIMKTEGFARKDLFREQVDLISEIDHSLELPIGYCFSYPAESLLNGDAKLIRWTKGVNIQEMIGKPIGEPLMTYMNEQGIAKFTSIKVINDTVAALFAGLAKTGYDAHIGLIVGTGTNMATFIPREHIGKLNPDYEGSGLIPVNLESGNFHPPHLTEADEEVDSLSDTPGKQRFEKAVSGMYLGEIFKVFFPPHREIEKFDAGDLNYILNNPCLHKPENVEVAESIFRRSAQLVAASLAGLILTLLKFNPSIRNICLTAEGSLFWSKIEEGDDYKEMVMQELQKLLIDHGYDYINVEVEEKRNINLIGTAVAALS